VLFLSVSRDIASKIIRRGKVFESEKQRSMSRKGTQK
jgi:hypothetical protein